MALKDLTPEQQAIDREIKRINAQIKAAYTRLGPGSRLAKQYETILMPGTGKDRLVDRQVYSNGKQQPMVRWKNGIPQISRSKAAIMTIQKTPVANDVIQLGRMQTVQSAQKAMIKAYEKRSGQKVKTAKDKKAAIESEVSRYINLEGSLATALGKMYAIERKRGIRLKAHDDIKKLSKGYWTSDDNMQDMLRIANEAITNDKAASVGDLLEGF